MTDVVSLGVAAAAQLLASTAISRLDAQQPIFNALLASPYRKTVSVSGAGGVAQTDYQVGFTVTYATGMRADFADIRLFDAVTLAEVPYWLETYTASTSAKVWVKLAVLPAAGRNLLMFYGDANAASKSNGAAVFPFFEDWSGGISASKWTTVTAGAQDRVNVNAGERLLPVSFPTLTAGDVQTVYWDGTNYWVGANAGQGIDGKCYKCAADRSVLATYTNFAPHCCSIDGRQDRATLLSGSGGDTTYKKIYEHQKSDGTKLREWDLTSLGGYGPLVTVVNSTNRVTVGMTNTVVSPTQLNVHILDLNDNGTFTVVQSFNPITPLATCQGFHVLGGYLYVAYGMVFDGQLAKYDISTPTPVLVETYTDLYANTELQGMSRNATGDGFLYIDAGGGGGQAAQMREFLLEPRKALRAITWQSGSGFAYVRSAATFAGPNILGVRAKMRGRFPMVGLADAGGTPPADAANNIVFGRLSSDTTPGTLKVRRKLAGAQLQTSYAGAAAIDSYRTYEIALTGSSVIAKQDGVALETFASGYPTGALPITLGSGTYGTTEGMSTSVAAVWVRKYAATEPTVTVAP